MSKAGPGCMCQDLNWCIWSGIPQGCTPILCMIYTAMTLLQSRSQVHMGSILLPRNQKRTRPGIQYTPLMRPRGSMCQPCMARMIPCSLVSYRCSTRRAYCRGHRRTCSWRTSGVVCICMYVSVCWCLYMSIHDVFMCVLLWVYEWWCMSRFICGFVHLV